MEILAAVVGAIAGLFAGGFVGYGLGSVLYASSSGPSAALWPLQAAWYGAAVGPTVVAALGYLLTRRGGRREVDWSAFGVLVGVMALATIVLLTLFHLVLGWAIFLPAALPIVALVAVLIASRCERPL